MPRLLLAARFCAVVWGLSTAHLAVAGERGGHKVTLPEAIERALQSAPGIRAREESLTGAEAQIRQAGVLPNPEAELEIENFGGSGAFKGFDESEMTLSATQRLELGGKRSARVSVAEADRDGATVERDRSRLDAALETQRAFFEASAAAALVEVTEARLTSAQQIEGMAQRRVRSARDPDTVRLRAEIETGDARSAHDLAKFAFTSAKARLAALWGESNTAFSVDTAALRALPKPSEIAAVTNASDVKAREAAARRAASNLELEKANSVPDVTVGLGVRRFEFGGDLAAVVSVSVPIPVFDTNQGNIDRAAAEERAARLDLEDSKRTADRERLSLEEEIARARSEAVTISRDLLPRAEQALRSARRGYDAGAFSYLELAESERTLNDLRTREIDALKRLHVAIASLDRLSGRTSVLSAKRGEQQ